MRTSPILLAGVMLIAACGSGSDEATEPTTPAETAAATTPATEPAATVPAATDAPVETTTTTTTTTTLAPTTTIDPVAQLRADIERDLNLGEQALFRAGENPGTEEALAILGEFFTDRSLEIVTELNLGFAADGLVVRPGDIPSINIVLDDPVRVNEDDPTFVTVRSCRIDAAILVEPTPAQDIVVNDVVTRYVGSSEMRLEDGVWKLAGGLLDEATPGVLTCDA